MNINEYFQQVTVIGAAGKMGSGISLLLAWEMTRLKNRMENRSRTYRLNLIDARQDGLSDLLAYIETQTAKRAERQIDEPLIQTFVDDVLSIIHTDADFRQARNSWLVFEAVPETERIKIDILRQLNEICTQNTFFLSNTSSIPIGFLDHETNLGGRIIGFHFYNPPAVQRLVELIPARTTDPELTALAHEIARRLGKTVVLSRDVAGFIGNGHFIRDALHAISEVEWLCRLSRAKSREAGQFDEAEARRRHQPRRYRESCDDGNFG